LITARIEGIPKDDSDALLRDLFGYIDDDQIIFDHKWRVGDLVMIDNRCITHARRDFPAGEPRMLSRTMVEGVPIGA
jgi:taurine dioxygenase